MNIPHPKAVLLGETCILVVFNILLGLGLPEARDYIVCIFLFSPSVCTALGTQQVIGEHLSKTAAGLPPSAYRL